MRGGRDGFQTQARGPGLWRFRSAQFSLSGFLQQGLEFRDGFQILRATRGALKADEHGKINAPKFDTKGSDNEGVGQEIAVTAATHDLAQQVQITQGGCQCKIKAVAKCGDVEFEGEAGGGAT